jgi:pimeloyl-ACP methyl ester carboxylesterase
MQVCKALWDNRHVRASIRRGLRYLWIIAGLSFTAWLYIGFQAVDLPDGVLKSDQYVAVKTTDHGLEFRGRVNARPVGVIFLPGGMVEPVAYAPLLRRIAGLGYPAHLLYLPTRCACTDVQVRELFQTIYRVIRAEPKMDWILSGHSRGGMLAARFVHEDDSGLAGLALIATTHPRDFSLAGATMPITKIYGTRDGVATYAGMRRNRHLLPKNTTWVEIPGANHVQFGYYRHQLGDDQATISRGEQQKLLEIALLNALSSAVHP